jgi:hypothetical protein
MVKGRPSCFTNLQWYLYHRFTFVHLTTPNSVIYKISEVQCDAIAVRFPFRSMDELPDTAPPAYLGAAPNLPYHWKVRNAKYRSEFTVKKRPTLHDFREQLECMKDSLHGHTYVSRKSKY